MQLLTTSRGLFKYWFFSLITFGIYPFYLIYALARELNLTCFEDNKRTTGLVGFILLSLITFGIYPIVWYCLAASRMGAFFVRRGWQPRITGTSFFCWMTFGILLFGIGPFVAMYKFLHSMNDINLAYNAAITQIINERNSGKQNHHYDAADFDAELHEHTFEAEDTAKKQI